jgi:hypothetical protein
VGQDGPVSYFNPSGQEPSTVGGAPQDQSSPQVILLPTGAASGESDPSTMVGQPAKVMRIGTMVKQLLEEVRAASLDEEGRKRLRDIYSASIRELKDGISPELGDELDRLSVPFGDDRVPTEAELRIGQAQLVGWLEGLFHGIQTALFAQQMAAQAQLQQMRALPAGSEVHPDDPHGAEHPSAGEASRPGGTGQYL